jgi:plastocyanin
MPGYVASPQVSSVRAGPGKAATRGTARGRVGTLLIATGMLTACVASPAALVWAQAPPPEAGAGAGPTVNAQEAEQPPAPQPPPPAAPPPQPSDSGQPPSTSAPGPGATPAPGQSTSPDDTPAPNSFRASSATAKAGSASVSILDGNSQSAFRFSPSSITVGSGDTVTWTNNGSEPHDVTGSGLGSGTLSSGQSYSHTFASPGTFSYICSIHPFMKGSVTVQASSGGDSGGASGSNTGTSPTAPGSESAAVTAAGAAGSDTQLPASGMPMAPLLAAGAALLVAGALLRRARVS